MLTHQKMHDGHGPDLGCVGERREFISEGGDGRGGTSGAEIFSVEQSIVTKEKVGEGAERG
jgi:hypothetical protein